MKENDLYWAELLYQRVDNPSLEHLQRVLNKTVSVAASAPEAFKTGVRNYLLGRSEDFFYSGMAVVCWAVAQILGDDLWSPTIDANEPSSAEIGTMLTCLSKSNIESITNKLGEQWLLKEDHPPRWKEVEEIVTAAFNESLVATA